ncbi:prominin-1-like [Lineus longissimus]|uniref:prominin-1-like n=1 Tax=Lineus longissimus TaxID=88925 RepID=UPI00315DAB9C
MPTHLASNGTIIFGKLNSSGTYTLGGYLDSYEGQAGLWSLGPWTAIATSFVDTFIKVPWDLIVRLKNSNFQLNVIINDWQEYAKLEAPMLVPFTIGVFLALIVPFVGLNLCCCRCCGRCGGKYTSKEAEKKSQSCGFMVGLGLIISCIFIILGACGFVGSSHRLHNTLPHVAEAAVYAVDDFSLFRDKFFEDLDLVTVREFKNVADIMSSELDRLPDEVTGPFMLAGRPVVQGITGNLLGLDKDLDALKDRLSEVDSISSHVTDSGDSIRVLIDEIKANLTTLKTTCSGSPDCGHMMDPNDVSSVYDFSKTPDMTGETASLGPVLSLDLKGIATMARNTFEDIPKQVNASAFDKANDIKDIIDGLIDPVQDALNTSVKPLVNGLFDSLAFNATKLRHEIRSKAEIITQKSGFQ